MALITNNLFPAFAGSGSLTKSWNYTTTDGLATVMARGYFSAMASQLGIGDTIRVAVVDAIAASSRTVLTAAATLSVSANDGSTVTTIGDSPAAVVQMFDDFGGDVLADQWGVRKGTDGAAVDFAVIGGVNGLIRGTMGAGAGGDMATNGIQLERSLNWRADREGLIFEARVRFSSAITNVSLFVGLTDQVSALEAPITSAASANTITTNASNAVGFMFDTSMTADTWWLVGVATDVDATHQNTAIVPVLGTYQTLRVEVSATGVAAFFLNGAFVGAAMTGAVTATTLLTPVIAGFTRTAAAGFIDVDYVSMQMMRV